MAQRHHPTWSTSFRDRASLPGTSPLAAYLLHLITIKKSNLCVSADVSTTSELLALAEEVGDSICLLKTHADIINDFSDRTVRGLRDIAKRKRFLVFEDRKLGDIGSTVQKQYTSGPLSIAKWAEIVNAHIFPGPAIVSALKAAASSAIADYNTKVHTEVTAGSPCSSTNHEDEEMHDDSVKAGEGSLCTESSEGARDLRKASVVSVSTTITSKTEPISPQPTPYIEMGDTQGAPVDVFAGLGTPPYLRALLLLAEMSSEGNLLTGPYTEMCVATARQHRDFVMGFIAQRSLNSEPDDNFITMTPGVSLPPPGQPAVTGDGLGQQYNSPEYVILEKGCDVIIVGRGIIKSENRHREAERYREAAWDAYQKRIAS
ncbi:orotidine 5'-phosphate decarboxylase [Verruconis gallopava]|uniref:Orotidine 5'-phosphate decarboxylase n=1 Tax=Verruconis gallopava TaxID=253628 RepID=A0A0D1YW30_9PEZI|nr:orotidine 5'-phosphate decarboxylase [Verruconis gallopava]KIW04897.1 orotidine 5'-phosphate decarboxylase [Verruconis gallopava]